MKPTNEQAIEKMADKIIRRLSDDISDRRGIKHEWELIDREVMEGELEPTWRKIIVTELGIAGYRLPDKPSTANREAVNAFLRKLYLNWIRYYSKQLGDEKLIYFGEAADQILSLIEPKVLSEEGLIKAIIELRKELKHKLIEQRADKPTDHEGHKCLCAKMRTCQDILNLVISQATINKVGE